MLLSESPNSDKHWNISAEGNDGKKEFYWLKFQSIIYSWQSDVICFKDTCTLIFRTDPSAEMFLSHPQVLISLLVHSIEDTEEVFGKKNEQTKLFLGGRSQGWVCRALCGIRGNFSKIGKNDRNLRSQWHFKNVTVISQILRFVFL